MKQTEEQIYDLVNFVKRLSYKLKRIDENDDLSNQAMAYLKANDLLGTPLRNKEIKK